MSKIIVFVQVHGRAEVLEADFSNIPTLGEFRAALETAGIKLDPESFIFIDEDEEHICGDEHNPVHRLKHGCRVHICRCKRIKTKVHYLEKICRARIPPWLVFAL